MKNIDKQIYSLLDNKKFNQARKIIELELNETETLNQVDKLRVEANLYGFLIDIGCESCNENDLNKAISFFEQNEQEFENLITKSSYYYNLANAKSGLAKIFYNNNRGVHSIFLSKDKLQDPINYYWLSYKTLDNDDRLLSQITINLSNSLMDIGRIVEALQFLDNVLRDYPDFPQALVSRGDILNHLSTVTNCGTTAALYTNIYQAYNNAMIFNSIPTYILEHCNFKKIEALADIKSFGFDIPDLLHEILETQKEYYRHSTFRKFYLDNFLTLNEHAIYCNCNESKQDDLQIVVNHGGFDTDLIPKLELLLNRLKSEFAIARKLYYQHCTEIELDDDVQFSELSDGEIINLKTELLRTSFRICYGILDKIALGICKLYEIDSKNIYFDTFWDEKKRKDDFDKIQNMHLNALYSIACDLNSKTGELRHFKTWRNKLEHTLLILRNNNDISTDKFNLFDDEKYVVVAEFEEFKSQTLHLLQLTRAAIFSFVFCVRLQRIEHREEYKEYFEPNFKN